jgi:cytochrome P450
MIHEESAALPEFRDRLDAEVDKTIKDPTALEQTEHETIYHHMLNPRVGYEQPSAKSMKEEAAILIGAGTETTGNACAVIAYHILSNVGVRRRLKENLVEAWLDPDAPMPLEKLEKLPYLVRRLHHVF